MEMLIEAGGEECFIECKFFEKINYSKKYKIVFRSFDPINDFSAYLPQNIYQQFIVNYSLNEAIVIFGSGTTGHSQGVILSHYTINVNADALSEYMKPGALWCGCSYHDIDLNNTGDGKTLFLTPSPVPIKVKKIKFFISGRGHRWHSCRGWSLGRYIYKNKSRLMVLNS